MFEEVEMSQTISVDEARKILGCGTNYIYLLIREGKIKSKGKYDGRLKLDEDSVIRYRRDSLRKKSVIRKEKNG